MVEKTKMGIARMAVTPRILTSVSESPIPKILLPNNRTATRRRTNMLTSQTVVMTFICTSIKLGR